MNKLIILVALLSMTMLTFSLKNHIIDPLTAKNTKLTYKNMELTDSIAYLNKKIHILKGKDVIETVIATVYHPVKKQTDNTPDILADGTKIIIDKASEYRYIGISYDLLEEYGGFLNLGDWVYIEGTLDSDGVYQVRDKMNRRWKKRIDILKTPGEPGFLCENVRLVKINIPGA